MMDVLNHFKRGLDQYRRGDWDRSIKAFQDAAVSQEFLQAWQKRIKDSEDAAAKAYEEQLKAQEEHDGEMRELGDMEDAPNELE